MSLHPDRRTAEPIVYFQCGLRVRSDIVLDLPVAAGETWDVDVRWAEAAHTVGQLATGSVIAEYVDGDVNWYTAFESEVGYALGFRDCGTFVIDRNLSAIVVHPQENGRTELLPILLAGTVCAFVLTLRGSTVLHASAVNINGSALAFIGQSGRGKSTMAALMCLDGAELVTDDLLAVDTSPPPTCLGGASELRLRAAAAHLADAMPHRTSRTTADDRRAFAPMPAPLVPTPLAAIVIPSPSRTATAVTSTRLSAGDALIAMMSFPRVHGWRHPGVLTNEFTTFSQIANEVPTFDMTIPWGPPFNPTIAQAIAELALSGAG